MQRFPRMTLPPIKVGLGPSLSSPLTSPSSALAQLLATATVLKTRKISLQIKNKYSCTDTVGTCWLISYIYIITQYIYVYKYKVCFYIHPFWSSIDWLPQTASVSSSSSSQSSGAKAPLVFQEPQRNQNEKSLGSLGKMYQFWYLIVYETKLQLKLDVQTLFCICDHTHFWQVSISSNFINNE